MKQIHLTTIATALLLSSAAAQADLSISNKPTHDMSCDGGICTATAPKAVLNVNDLQTMLASADVTVKTGSIASNIDIDQPLQWTSTSRLTLDVRQSVIVNKKVTVEKAGALTITTNDGGSGGDLYFIGKGSVCFGNLSSSLIVNGNGYTLVGDIKTLASDIATNPFGFYALAAPYDAGADGTYGDAPVTTTLAGVIEGLNNSISNLNISASNITNVGLFAAIGVAGTVRDLQVSKAVISGYSPVDEEGHLGILAGVNDGDVLGVRVSGDVDAGGNEIYAGGLAGRNTGLISMDDASVRLTVNGDVPTGGGLVGELDGSNGGVSKVDRSAARGKLDMRFGYAGGLIGISLNNSTITNSRAAVGLNISSEYGYGVGGLAGFISNSVIQESYAMGKVSASTTSDARHCVMSVGGLVGLATTDVRIANAYATGTVQGNMQSCLGGCIGWSFAEIGTSYSVGPVIHSEASRAGGFVGQLSNKRIRNSYWDIDTSGPNEGAGNRQNPGLVGLSDAQLKSGLPTGFDPKIWGSDPKINNGYPYLLANPPSK